MRSIRAKAVVKQLIKFCSVFGLPKVIQTDQGSNLTSALFSQVLGEIAFKHQLSSPLLITSSSVSVLEYVSQWPF